MQIFYFIVIFLAIAQASTCEYDAIDLMNLAERLSRNTGRNHTKLSICNGITSLSEIVKIEEEKNEKIEILKQNEKEIERKLSKAKEKKTEIEKFLVSKNVMGRFTEIKKLEETLNKRQEDLRKAEHELKNLRVAKEAAFQKTQQELADERHREAVIINKIRGVEDRTRMVSTAYENIKAALKNLEMQLVNKNTVIAQSMELQNLIIKHNQGLGECHKYDEILQEYEKEMKELKEKRKEMKEKLELIKEDKQFGEEKTRFEENKKAADQLEKIRIAHERVIELRRKSADKEEAEEENKEETRKLAEATEKRNRIRKEAERLEKEITEWPGLVDKLEKEVKRKKQELEEVEKITQEEQEKYKNLVKLTKRNVVILTILSLAFIFINYVCNAVNE